FFSSRRRHTRFSRDWSSDVCSSDLGSSLRGRPGRRRSTSLTASPRRYLRTVFLEIFSSLAIARMLTPRRDKILISTTASFVSIQGPPLLNPDGPDFQQRWVNSFVRKGSISDVRSHCRRPASIVDVEHAAAREVLRPALAGLRVQTWHGERRTPGMIIADVVPPADPDVSTYRYQFAETARPITRKEQPVAVVRDLGLAVGPRSFTRVPRVRVDFEAFRLVPRRLRMGAARNPDVEVEHLVVGTAGAVRREIKRAPVPRQLCTGFLELGVDRCADVDRRRPGRDPFPGGRFGPESCPRNCRDRQCSRVDRYHVRSSNNELRSPRHASPPICRSQWWE